MKPGLALAIQHVADEIVCGTEARDKDEVPSMCLCERGKAKQSVSLWQQWLSALGSCSCKNHDLPLCQHVSRGAKALPCKSRLGCERECKHREYGQTVEKAGKCATEALSYT